MDHLDLADPSRTNLLRPARNGPSFEGYSRRSATKEFSITAVLVHIRQLWDKMPCACTYSSPLLKATTLCLSYDGISVLGIQGCRGLNSIPRMESGFLSVVKQSRSPIFYH
jgi:hypothetical protein